MAYKSNLKNVLNAIEKAESRALTSIGIFIQGESISRSPVGKYPPGSGRVGGNLRDSNNFRVESSKKEVILGNSAEYAVWVHEGTPRQSPQPWLEESVYDNVSKMKRLVSEAMKL